MKSDDLARYHRRLDALWHICAVTSAGLVVHFLSAPVKERGAVRRAASNNLYVSRLGCAGSHNARVTVGLDCRVLRRRSKCFVRKTSRPVFRITTLVLVHAAETVEQLLAEVGFFG